MSIIYQNYSGCQVHQEKSMMECLIKPYILNNEIPSLDAHTIHLWFWIKKKKKQTKKISLDAHTIQLWFWIKKQKTKNKKISLDAHNIQ